MRYKIRKFLLISYVFLVYIFLPFPNIVNPSQNNPHMSGAYIPAGLIALWSGTLDSIPEGWALCDGIGGTPDTNNRFVWNTNGTENPGAIEGITTHLHSYSELPLHDHGTTDTALCTHSHTYTATSSRGNANTGYNDVLSANVDMLSATLAHSHDCSSTGSAICYTSTQSDILPSYRSLAFIEKLTTDPIIPIGVIFIWTGPLDDIPQGWNICNGAQNTPDLQDRFIIGTTSENPGQIGGNITHLHTYTEIPQHSHSITTNEASHNHPTMCSIDQMSMGTWPWTEEARTCQLGTTNSTTILHTHTINDIGQLLCSTSEASHLPPYTTVAFIMNTQSANEIPTGCVCFWGNEITSIPLGWTQCDGTGDTLDLREQFLKGSSASEPIGSTGGSLTHTHGYTEIPLHGHTLSIQDLTHSHPIYAPVDYLSYSSFGGVIEVYISSSSPKTTVTSSAAHAHTVSSTGIENPITNPENNLPPSLKLTYIQCITEPTQIEWTYPSEGSLIQFPKTPVVQFNFSYSHTGVGNDITLTLFNGTDSFDAGSVWNQNSAFINFLNGDVTAVLHLWQDTTELAQTTRSFVFLNNLDPEVFLTRPYGGETISGTYVIHWIANDPDGDSLSYQLEYNLEETGWILLASGITTTQYSWDTTSISYSESILLRITATDGFGGEYSNEGDGSFSIDNREPVTPKKIPGYNIPIVISLMALSSLILVWKRKKRPFF